MSTGYDEWRMGGDHFVYSRTMLGVWMSEVRVE